MSSIQNKRKSMETMIIQTHPVGQPNYQYYRQYKQQSLQQPSLVMYQLLRSIIRKLIRQPFQRIKPPLPKSYHHQEQIERRHTKYELQVIGENITNVVTSIQQRIIIESFVTFKNIFNRQIRIEQTYYNSQNINALVYSLAFLQKQATHFKLQAFRQLKTMLKQKRSLTNLQSYGAIQAINSYIIDNQHQQGKSERLIKRSKKESRFSRQQHKQIKHYQSIENHFQSAQTNHKRLKQYIQDSNHNEQLQSKVFITHHKNTHNQQQQSHNLNQRQNHVFLIQDYRIKPKQPTNFIKIPIAAQNVKIRQFETGRKWSKKKRMVRKQQQIQRQICEDCKYCRQMKQRKQILKVLQQGVRGIA